MNRLGVNQYAKIVLGGGGAACIFPICFGLTFGVWAPIILSIYESFCAFVSKRERAKEMHVHM